MKARSEMLKQVQHDGKGRTSNKSNTYREGHTSSYAKRHPELVSGSVRGEEQERLNRKFQDLTEDKEPLSPSTKKYYI